MGFEYDELKAKKYARLKILVFAANFVLTLMFLLIFQFLFSDKILESIHHIHNYYIAGFIFSSAFLAFTYLVGFPLHFISSFVIERYFALSEEKLKAWFTDEIKSVILSYFLSVSCILVFYSILRNFPTSWWLIAAFLWFFFLAVLTHIAPILFIPMFFRYLPINNETLKTKIMALANKANIFLVDVCQINFSRKTKKLNAALVGLGKTHRVILADTLIEKFSSEEVESVVAHEFGHYKKRHSFKLLLFSGILTMALFYILFLFTRKLVLIMGAGSISDFNLLAILVFLLVISEIVVLPIHNSFSRFIEREADRFCLSLTNSPNTFISVMRKLAVSNLANLNPSYLEKIFFYNHPPILERISMAERFKAK